MEPSRLNSGAKQSRPRLRAYEYAQDEGAHIIEILRRGIITTTDSQKQSEAGEHLGIRAQAAKLLIRAFQSEGDLLLQRSPWALENLKALMCLLAATTHIQGVHNDGAAQLTNIGNWAAFPPMPSTKTYVTST
ncbi:hypothetical protein INS49_012835 [Diaporthe citri]|uniref:uncharacterized protein n=1 Tax=Diaporthe citri TaxID=83186 RepID=UPI001C812AFC|nr:uncharacterized protein INS49_012835 [Diaporthe citri]KAG6359314.1 hypothetical protein INS49_012835 [Diaporthe citri]